MIDTRFTTAFDDLQDLLGLVDVDEVGDIETLLMFLFGRPIGVDEAWADHDGAASLDVTVPGNDYTIRSTYEFPLSVMELVRACAETVADLGPYTGNGDFPAQKTQDVMALSDAALVTALQQALGKVRFFNLMDSDE